MKPEAGQPQDTPQYHEPVAYDAQGRPLYAHPPVQQPPVPEAPQAPQVVQLMRPLEPAKPEVSPEAKARREESMKLYPFLNLSDGEYVIRSVRRHPIGLLLPMGLGSIIIGILLSVLFNYDLVAEALGLTGQFANTGLVAIPILLLSALVGLGMFVAYYVYVNNRFFLTNESVIQEIQTSLFSRHEQTVSLGSIEDASYRMTNIVQHILNYGDIRLSTEGEETTYRFTYVGHPKTHIAVLNNAVEDFKNGRPVGEATD